MNSVYAYIAAMALVTYCIRALPLTLLRRNIQNRFLRSFLYYVPYVTLAVMTFPAILTATGSPVAAGAGFAVAVLLAYKGRSLITVALTACITVFVLEMLLVR